MTTITDYLGLELPADGDSLANARQWGDHYRNAMLALEDALLDVGVNVKAYGATGNGLTDDTAACLAAIAAAGIGGRVFWPAGIYQTSALLAPLTAQTWSGTGMTRYDGTAGTTIKYTGSGIAVDLTSRNNVTLRDMKIEVTNTAAVALKWQETNYCSFEHLTISGPNSSGTSYGLKSEGSVGCQCHNTMVGVQIQGFRTGISLSGFSNANHFLNCAVQNVNIGVNFTATGSDTTGGNDNLFERLEEDGSTATGLVIASIASRNVFLKCVQDGVTTGGSIASGCQRNVFIACVLVNALTDSASNLTLFLLTPGQSTGAGDGLSIGDVNLYRTGTNQWKTDDDLHVASSGGGIALKVGAYVGSLASSTGLGVFGNSEFSNALAIGGALNHDGSQVGFYGTAPAAKPTVTGSRGGNAALASLLTGLANLGLITDSSSA